MSMVSTSAFQSRSVDLRLTPLGLQIAASTRIVGLYVCFCARAFTCMACCIRNDDRMLETGVNPACCSATNAARASTSGTRRSVFPSLRVDVCSSLPSSANMRAHISHFHLRPPAKFVRKIATMPSRCVRRSRLEVEHKFHPDPILHAQLDGKHGEYERLRRTQKAPVAAQPIVTSAHRYVPREATVCNKEIRDECVDCKHLPAKKGILAPAKLGSWSVSTAHS